MTPVILASSSPRRRQLLTLLDIPFTTYSTDIDESLSPNTPPDEAVEILAEKKAAAAFQTHDDSVILGCDTIVVYDGEILGKPRDSAEAYATLSRLSGHTHSVYTGVCIMSKEKSRCFHVKTEVTFWKLTDEDINAYIDSNAPFDKAGSYGIQDKGALFVKEIKGDYYSVMGLPVSRLSRELSKFR
ncbi:MAG: Maf family protein [Bacillus sp. (in: firmicutes)]